MDRSATLLVVLVVLAPSAAAAWAQYHHDAAHSGLIDLDARELDVVASLSTLDEGWTLGVSPVSTLFVPTPRGLAGIAYEDATGACVLVLVSGERGESVERIPLPEDCRYESLRAYDASTDRLITCGIGRANEAILVARALATGARVWAIVPTEDLGVVDPGSEIAWGCTMLALDPAAREIVAPFIGSRIGMDNVQHRIASVDAVTGGVRWVAQVPIVAQLASVGPVVPGTDGGNPGWLPSSVTLTTTGVVVTGVAVCLVACDNPYTNDDRENTPFQGTAAWLTRGGVVRGLAFDRDPLRQGPSTDAESGAYTSGATASGPYAGIQMGGRLLILNPLEPDPVSSVPVETYAGTRSHAGPSAAPIWTGTRIHVPIRHSVTAFESIGPKSLWTWSMPEVGWLVEEVLATPAGRVLVLAAHQDDPGSAYGHDGEVRIVTLDANGKLLSTVAFYLETPYRSPPAWDLPNGDRFLFYPIRLIMVPYGAGLAVAATDGRLVILGTADPALAPQLSIPDAFPPRDSVVEVSMRMVEDANISIVWGDGHLDTLSTSAGEATASHVFDADGRHRIVVTARYADGRTATASTFVDVGGTPPPDLNFMQQAFSPKWQETTWGLLGLAIALIGALVALLARARRRRGLERELAAIEHLRERAEADPVRGLREVARERTRLTARLTAGRLDEAQYGVVSDALARLARRLLGRLVSHAWGNLSPGYRHLLEATMADGHMSLAEAAALRARLATENTLGAEERADLERLLDAWSHMDGADPAPA